MHMHSIILRVADLTRSASFYRNTLRLTIDREIPRFAFFKTGAVTIGLNQVAPDKAGAGTCLTEIVFNVDDIHAEHARLTAAGVEFLMPPTHVSSDDTHDLYAAAFRDPDGHLLSIASRVAK